MWQTFASRVHYYNFFQIKTPVGKLSQNSMKLSGQWFSITSP